MGIDLRRFAPADSVVDLEVANHEQHVCVVAGDADVSSDELARIELLLDDPAIATVSLVGGTGTVTVAAPVGGVVAIARGAIGLVGLARDAPDLIAAVGDVGVRSAGRGFRNVALGSDRQPSEVAVHPWLLATHLELEPVLSESVGRDAPINMVLAGGDTSLSVVIDGSCFAATESGTQVQTRCLLEALAQRDDISRLVVVMVGDLPEYARSLSSISKVEVRRCSDGLEFPDLVGFDIVHRPFQPHGPLPLESWRRSASRIVLTVLDLISYEVGPYHASGERWNWFRTNFLRSVGAVDAVIAISDDVAYRISEQRLPIASERLAVVRCGLDHITGASETQEPSIAGRDGNAPFALMLGTSFAHKNHDVGLAAWRSLRERHPTLDLVLAGHEVQPHRMERAEGVYVLGGVTSSERNWLLSNASIVLYPTSAEGFGFVPFEAAALGTPTVSVAFGPLLEVGPADAVYASGWSPEDLADAGNRVLGSPSAQVSAYAAVSRTRRWSDVAHETVAVYRRALAMPSLGPIAVDEVARRLTGETQTRLDHANARIEAFERSRAVRFTRGLRQFARLGLSPPRPSEPI